MFKEIIDKIETLLAYCIIGLLFGGFPLFLFVHAVITVAD